MAEPWFKVGSEILRNPKVYGAGPHGLLVFLELLGGCVRHDRDGVLSASQSCALHLQKLLIPWRMTTKKVDRALDLLEKQGLVRRLVDGRLVILGWDDQWKPAYDPAARQRKRRSKLKQDHGIDLDAEEELSREGRDQASQDARDNVTTPRHAPEGGREVASEGASSPELVAPSRTGTRPRIHDASEEDGTTVKARQTSHDKRRTALLEAMTPEERHALGSQ